jgi:hypothetical protein
MATGDRIFYRPPVGGGLATTGTSDSLTPTQQPFLEAIVVDVIVDHTHPEYGEDGFNVGAVQIRMFSVNHGIDDDQLPWADPLDFTIKQLPLVGEMVVIYDIQGNKYYSRQVPMAHRVQENGMLNLNKQLANRLSNTLANALVQAQEITTTGHRFGKYFKPDSRVRPLKHFEGDTIIEGRMGQSIRFGSSHIDPSTDGLAPNIILRAGQAKDAEIPPLTTGLSTVTKNSQFGLILEDVNNDASSIWMVSDQIVPFVPITSEVGSFVRSVANPPQKYDKASIIINSGRVILNAKNTHVLLFANEGIHLNSYKDTTIDTDSNIIFTANKEINLFSNKNIESITDEDFMITAGSDVISLAMEKTAFFSNKIYLGTSEDDSEPMVGGTSLSKFLARLIHALVNGEIKEPPTSFTPGSNETSFVITPMGSGLLAPGVVAALETLYYELVPQNPGQVKNKLDFAGAPFNSQANFVMLQNEKPQMKKNEFKEGKQRVMENSEWLLSQKYYRAV